MPAAMEMMGGAGWAAEEVAVAMAMVIVSTTDRPYCEVIVIVNQLLVEEVVRWSARAAAGDRLGWSSDNCWQ